MKKYLALLLALVMALSLVACGGSQGGNTHARTALPLLWTLIAKPCTP